MTHLSGPEALCMRALIAIVIVASFAAPSAAQQPAFPGAEGPGANATGGRGGDVYHVTNLEFDKDGLLPGSLKYGINTAPAAGRTIVFDVGGTIYQPGGGSNWWFRSGKSNLTIAGQTAPGGITIAGTGTKWTGDNIVLRNISVRTNQDPVNPTSFTYDGISTQATNSIIDHVSVSWFSDEGISATDAVNNTTVQYATIGEGLNYNGHSFGSIINTQNGNAPLAFHHNLYAHNKSRNPRLGSETGTGAVTNFYNNVVYDWSGNAGYSALNADTSAQEPSRTNFINNFYMRGAANGSTIFSSAGNATQIYQAGNLYDSNKDGDYNDGVAVTWSNFSGTETQLATPLTVAGGVIDSATVGRDRVLAYGGANWWDRSAIDARIIGSVSTGAGNLVNTVPTAEWNSVVTAPMISRPAGWDTDGDGMPDGWEAKHGLDPQTAAHNGDFDADGYTDLEEYLNGVAEWPAPQPIVFNAATNNRFAQITNWDIKWQPSRFDTAVIAGGAVVVDAVGQHAGVLRVAPNAGQSASLDITAGWLEVHNSLQIATAGTSGAVNLSGGALRVGTITKGAGGSLNLTGGVLSADAVQFSLTNNGGVLSPGETIGMTSIVGDFTMNDGALAIDLASPTVADSLDISGVFTLGGDLNVSLLDGFDPTSGSWVIANANSFSGAFDSVTPGFAVIQQGNDLVLSVAPALPGDYNADGIVDAADYTVWRDGGSPDSSVGGYNVWVANYGASAMANGSAVPEPGSALLLSLVGVLSLASRRRLR
jgi:hypothetical protein